MEPTLQVVYNSMGTTSSCASQDDDFLNYWVDKTVEKEILRGKKLREQKPRQSANREKYDVITIGNSKLYCEKERPRRRKKSPNTSRRRQGRKSTHSNSPIRKKNHKRRKLSYKYSNLSNKRCPLRIAELAVPSKRQCIATWRSNYHILPSIMLHRLQQHIFNLAPVVKIPEAIECFKRHKRLEKKKRKQETIKAIKADVQSNHCVNHIEKKPIKLQECQNLCAIFGHQIAKKLNRPVVVTLNSELEKISNVVSIEIDNLIRKDKGCGGKSDRNKKTQAEVAGKISIWIANILEETAYKILDDQLKDLEEEVGPVLDLIDNLIDDVVSACEPEPSIVESPSAETVIVESSSEGKHEEDNQTEDESHSSVEKDEDDNQTEDESHSSVEIDFPDAQEINVDEYIQNELDKIINSFDGDGQQDTEIENQTQQDIKEGEGGEQEQNEFSDAYDSFDIQESTQDQTTNQDKFDDPESQQNTDRDKDLEKQQHQDENTDQDNNVQQGTVKNKDQDKPYQITDGNLDQVNSQQSTDRYIDQDGQLQSKDRNIDQDGEQQSTEKNVDLDNLQPDTDRNENQENLQQSTDRNVDLDNSQQSSNKNEIQENLQQSTDGNINQDNLQQSTDRNRDQDGKQQKTDSNIDQDDQQQGTDRNIDQDNQQQNTDRNVSQDYLQQINKNTDQDDVQNSTDRNIDLQDISEDDSNKKVTFSNIDIVTNDNDGTITTEPADVNFQDIQEIDTNLVFAEPNDHLLTDADEPWPADMTLPILRPSESVSKSITSLGRIMETEERISTLDEDSVTVPFTTNTDRRDGQNDVIDGNQKSISSDEVFILDDQLTNDYSRTSSDSTFDHHVPIDKIPYEMTLDKILEEQATQVAEKLDKLLENAAIQAGVDTRWEDEGIQVSQVIEEKKAIDSKEEGIQVSSKDDEKGKTADKEINTSFLIVPRVDKSTSVVSKSLEDITKRIQGVKPDDMFSSLRIKQKVDYKVHKKSAPYWVARHYEEPPSVSFAPPQQKTGDKHIRLWCRDLENGFANLELWNGWIENTLEGLSILEHRKARICVDKSREEFVRDWYQLKKNIDTDVLTWTKLGKSTQDKLKAFRKVYQNFETLSPGPNKTCHCHP